MSWWAILNMNPQELARALKDYKERKEGGEEKE